MSGIIIQEEFLGSVFAYVALNVKLRCCEKVYSKNKKGIFLLEPLEGFIDHT